MARGFFGHAGRPGQRGGSAPADAGLTMRDANKARASAQSEKAKEMGISRKTLQNKISAAKRESDRGWLEFKRDEARAKRERADERAAGPATRVTAQMWRRGGS